MARWRTVRNKRRWIARWSLGAKDVNRSRLFLRFAKLGFVGILILFLSLFIILPLLAFNLPSPDKIIRREGFSTKIMDRHGNVLYDIFADQKRTPVELKDIPEYLREGTVAIEDKNFYKHQGFDPFGMLRGFSRIFTRGYAQGGSTLTQQLVKNVLLNPERTLWRKIKEFLLAIQIERRYGKDEILQMYLNEAPYGGTAWGVGSAAETYFGKDVKNLNLIESAFLAGLPQRPSVYSPYSSSPNAYKDRTAQVLRRMREDGYINEETEKSALDELETLEFKPKGADFKAPHFVQYVQKLLEDRYGERVVEQGGLRVTTTVDLELQEKAEEIVGEEIEKVKNLKISNGAAVILDPETGEILAMVGSRGFGDPDIDGQVNVTLSLRQPGSAIKPFTYVTAFKKGYTPATLLLDTPTEFPGGPGQPMYKPVNYDGKFRGPVQARYALANSINIPAVKMLATVGIKDMLATANDLGISSLEPTKETLSRVGLSVTLGGGEVRLLEISGAYQAFVNGGFRADPTAILKVEDSEGKVLETNTPKKGRRVLTPEQAYLIFDILSDNDARKEVFGLNSLLNIPGKQIAVKTGTTNDKRDNWTIGGNSQRMVGVWVGNNDNSPMQQVVSGVTGASPIWRKILIDALKNQSAPNTEIPGGIITTGIDIISGYAAHDGFPSRTEKFVAGTQPAEDPVHKKLKICKSDGKLATPADTSSGNYEEKEFIVLSANDPVSTDGVNRWQEGIDVWIATQTDGRYRPPKDYCGTTNPLTVEFVEPKDRTSNLSTSFKIKISADSTNDISEVTLEADGERVRSFTQPPFEHTISLDNGVHTLRARARDTGGNESDRVITVGVNTAWDYSPSPIPTPTPVPELTIVPTI